jgi:hypothetical protein
MTLRVGSSSVAPAATFSVTTTNDTGPDSLRQAITEANASPGSDIIAFNISGTGLTISLASALPDITDPVVVNGTNQPGFAGAPIVELNGASVAAGVDGLHIVTSNCVIRGLVINRFKGNGIEIATNGFNLVEGCYIGLGLDGTTVRANTLNGILVTNSANNIIGGTNAVGNLSDGISLIYSPHDNLIGPSNVIAFNSTGVSIVTGTNNLVTRNSIFANTSLGVSLDTSGVTDNDTGDNDTGANWKQNFPALADAVNEAGALTVSGTLNSKPSQEFRLEFYDNDKVDDSGYGEGRPFLGDLVVTATGQPTFSSLRSSLPRARWICSRPSTG